MEKTIGILGGMGPYATIDLFHKIVSNTPANIDQDHHKIIIYNNPKIPSRMEAFNKGAKSPLQELIQSALVLERAGADFIIIACNSAHIWLDELRRNVNIPIYSMIENTVQHLLGCKSSINEKILLFATESTIHHQLYQNAFKGSPYKIVVPNKEEQKVVNRAIYDVKTGKVKGNVYIKKLNQMIETYQTEGVSMIIGGCTEIPLLFPYFATDIKLVDPTLLLAKLAIKKAMNI
ncbi:cysteate racemase [Lederbergia citri]|uniref:Amino acid racemase n=1 Tax=Lederbergia citri TaxID=2833580 RepID=A0A942TBU7_9BACI|nr:amino acid racemase [Lederbergia citri]MBS4194895.1 amino acid racemase [Lederbergia citri]